METKNIRRQYKNCGTDNSQNTAQVSYNLA